MSNQKDDGLPLGFGMALAQNEQAMEHFSTLPKSEKQAVVDGARQVRSKQEMQKYVEKISRNE